MARRFYAHEYPKIPSGCPWVKIVVQLTDGRRLRGTYHGNGRYICGGTTVSKQVVYWWYD